MWQFFLLLISKIKKAAGSAIWGSITGTLSEQTDLKNALDDKVTKVTGETTFHQLYGKTNLGAVAMYNIAQNTNGTTIMMRNSSGRSQVTNPVENYDIANKQSTEQAINAVYSLNGTELTITLY